MTDYHNEITAHQSIAIQWIKTHL